MAAQSYAVNLTASPGTGVVRLRDTPAPDSRVDIDSAGRAFPQGALQRRAHTKSRRIPDQVVEIQATALHRMMPRMSRHCPSGTVPLLVPAELLQQDVLRRMHVQDAIAGQADCLTPRELLLVQRRAAGDMDVDLKLRGLMDQIRDRAIPSGGRRPDKPSGRAPDRA